MLETDCVLDRALESVDRLVGERGGARVVAGGDGGVVSQQKSKLALGPNFRKASMLGGAGVFASACLDWPMMGRELWGSSRLDPGRQQHLVLRAWFSINKHQCHHHTPHFAGQFAKVLFLFPLSNLTHLSTFGFSSHVPSLCVVPSRRAVCALYALPAPSLPPSSYPSRISSSRQCIRTLTGRIACKACLPTQPNPFSPPCDVVSSPTPKSIKLIGGVSSWPMCFLAWHSLSNAPHHRW